MVNLFREESDGKFEQQHARAARNTGSTHKQRVHRRLVRCQLCNVETKPALMGGFRRDGGALAA